MTSQTQNFFIFWLLIRLLQNIDISKIIDIKKNIEYSILLWVKYRNIKILILSMVGKMFEVFKGPYADHILIPQGSTGSSIFFDIKWKPLFF